MRLMQVKTPRGGRQVVATEGGESWFVKGYRTVYDLANAAIARKTSLAKVVAKAGKSGAADPQKPPVQMGRFGSPFSNSIQTLAPTAPVTDDRNDAGSYWKLSLAVPYRHDYYA